MNELSETALSCFAHDRKQSSDGWHDFAILAHILISDDSIDR